MCIRDSAGGVLAEALALDPQLRRDVRVEELRSLFHFDVRGDLCGDPNVGAGKVGAGKLFVCVNGVAVGRADPQSARAASGRPAEAAGPRAPVVFRFGVNFFEGSDGRRRGPPSGLLAQPPRPGGRRGARGSCCSVCWAAALPQTTKLFAYNFMGVGGVASMIFRARRATRNVP